jgi:hypothetical protein
MFSKKMLIFYSMFIIMFTESLTHVSSYLMFAFKLQFVSCCLHLIYKHFLCNQKFSKCLNNGYHQKVELMFVYCLLSSCNYGLFWYIGQQRAGDPPEGFPYGVTSKKGVFRFWFCTEKPHLMTHWALWAENYATVGSIRTISTTVMEALMKLAVKTKERKFNRQDHIFFFGQRFTHFGHKTRFLARPPLFLASFDVLFSD